MVKKQFYMILLLSCYFSGIHLGSIANGAPFRVEILKNPVVVAKEPGRYCAWPSIGKLPNGRLIVVYNGDRDWHVCPWGKIQKVVSDDDGESWSDPVTIVNTPLDDRESGVLVTGRGTILISYRSTMTPWSVSPDHRWYRERYAQYAEYAATITEAVKRQYEGNWIVRSEDGGASWGDPISVPFLTPHGPIQLRDGRILMVTGAGVAESDDDGLTWRVLARFGPDYGRLSEVHAVERADGEIIALSRAPKLRQFGSSDGGRTWSEPFETPMTGYPPHLIELDNGALVAAYGRRSGLPMGQFASISLDGAKSWKTEREITLAIADKHRATEEELGYPPGWDLGYPGSVQLADGTVWTVYYQSHQNGEWPSIMGTRWKIKVNDPVNAEGFRHLASPPAKELPQGSFSHLDIDFSSYRAGDVKGQSGGTGGPWAGGSAWFGEVVPINENEGETQALRIYRTEGGSLGRGLVPICPRAPGIPGKNLSLEVESKIYWAADIYAPSRNSTLTMIMCDSSPGKVDQTGFRIVFNSTAAPVGFASSVQDSELTMTESFFTPELKTWYRFEVEITQSKTPGAGTFSVFVSTSAMSRKMIIENQPYSFQATQFPSLFITPVTVGSRESAVFINNIVLRSGLTKFPSE